MSHDEKTEQLVMMPLKQADMDEAGSEVHDSDTKKERYHEDDDNCLNITDIGKEMRKALLLSVAYSANIGGTGVVTATGTNMILMVLLEGCAVHRFSDKVQII